MLSGMPTKIRSQQSRFEANLAGLRQFAARTGSGAPASTHVEIVGRTPIPLGNWVGYLRQRYRVGKLSAERIGLLEAIPGWVWADTPGPTPNPGRDDEMRARRAAGESLRSLAESYNVTRQRCWQITRDVEEFA